MMRARARGALSLTFLLPMQLAGLCCLVGGDHPDRSTSAAHHHTPAGPTTHAEAGAHPSDDWPPAGRHAWTTDATAPCVVTAAGTIGLGERIREGTASSLARADLPRAEPSFKSPPLVATLDHATSFDALRSPAAHPPLRL